MSIFERLTNMQVGIVNFENKQKGSLQTNRSNFMNSNMLSTSKKQSKTKYQNNFNALLERMQLILNDLLLYEVEFKRQFFNIKVHEQTRKKLRGPREESNCSRSQYSTVNNSNVLSSDKNKILRRTQTYKSKSNSSVSNSNGSNSYNKQYPVNRARNLTLIQQKEQENQILVQQQQERDKEVELFKHLNIKLRPQELILPSRCALQNSIDVNLSKLNDKIEHIVTDMRLKRKREQQLIDLFQFHRINQIQQLAFQKDQIGQDTQQAYDKIFAKKNQIQQKSSHSSSSEDDNQDLINDYQELLQSQSTQKNINFRSSVARKVSNDRIPISPKNQKFNFNKKTFMAEGFMTQLTPEEDQDKSSSQKDKI